MSESIEKGDFVTFDYQRIHWMEGVSVRHKGAGYVEDVRTGTLLGEKLYDVRMEEGVVKALNSKEVRLHAKQAKLF